VEGGSSSSPDASGLGAADREALARVAWASVTRVFFSHELHERFHDAAAAVGLPHPGSLKALTWLDAERPQSMRALAQDMRCDASYITSLVDALEELGYVERRVSAADRRVKLVQVTAEGRLAQQKAEAVITQPPSSMARLDDDELALFASLVAKLVEER
jgi:DNA-binding MarR family transcriptional regulator